MTDNAHKKFFHSKWRQIIIYHKRRMERNVTIHRNEQSAPRYYDRLMIIRKGLKKFIWRPHGVQALSSSQGRSKVFINSILDLETLNNALFSEKKKNNPLERKPCTKSITVKQLFSFIDIINTISKEEMMCNWTAVLMHMCWPYGGARCIMSDTTPVRKIGIEILFVE